MGPASQARRQAAIIGAAGQAREIRWYLRAMGIETIAMVVRDVDHPGPYDGPAELLRDEAWLATHRGEWDALVMGIAEPALRDVVAQRIRALHPAAEWPVVVHPSAVLDASSVTLGEGVVVGAGAVVTTGVALEAFTLVNFGATVGHDVVVGRGSIINPGANVSGGVRIGANVLVGAGAVIRQYLSVGDGATIGAGAVVTKDVPPGTTVVGVPARPLVGRAPK